MIIKDIEQLIFLLGQEDNSAFQFMANELKNLYDKEPIIVPGETGYLWMPGEIPVVINAHADTEGRYFPQQEDIMIDNGIIQGQDLAADDRTGLYSILQLVRGNLRPHVIITMGEENRGAGMRAFSNAMGRIPQGDVNFVLGLDRRNFNDAVFYGDNNPSFRTMIESFGFREARGTYSDIATLSFWWNVSGVNLSMGYNDRGVISIEQLHDSIDHIFKILSNNKITSTHFKFIRRPENDAWMQKWGNRRLNELWVRTGEESS